MSLWKAIKKFFGFEEEERCECEICADEFAVPVKKSRSKKSKKRK